MARPVPPTPGGIPVMTPMTASAAVAARPSRTAAAPAAVPAAPPRAAPARPEPARTPTPAATPAATTEPARARPAEPPAPKRPSFLARGLSALAGGLVRIFVRARTRGATAVGDFRARPEHSRWRAYALGCYGLIVAATLAGQLYSSNPLGVYVKVQHVDLPVSTLIFVRNDSRFAWKRARIVVNGIYSHSRDEIAAGESLPLDLDKAFAVHDGSGRILRRPPRNLPLQSLALDCDRGHYETELK
jgi:hypothetical protein